MKRLERIIFLTSDTIIYKISYKITSSFHNKKSLPINFNAMVM